MAHAGSRTGGPTTGADPGVFIFQRCLQGRILRVCSGGREGEGPAVFHQADPESIPVPEVAPGGRESGAGMHGERSGNDQPFPSRWLRIKASSSS